MLKTIWQNESLSKYHFFISMLLIFIISFTVSSVLRIYSDEVIENYGFIFGSFSHIHPFIRISFIGAFGFLTVLTFALLSYVSFQLKGSSFIQPLSGVISGGVLSNIVDRIIHRNTVDYFHFKTPIINIVWNLADIFIILSTIIFIYTVIFRYELIFGTKNKRKFFFDKKEQFYLLKYFMMAYSATFFIVGLFNFSLIFNLLTDLNLTYSNQNISYYISALLTLYIAGLIVVFILAIELSKRLIGPIKALYRFIESIESSDSKFTFKLRNGDRLKELEKIVYEIHSKIKSLKK